MKLQDNLPTIFILLLLIFLPLFACAGGWEDFQGALSGSKKKTTDEYLIKEKDPLILPPDFKNLPLPDSHSPGVPCS